MAWTDDYIGIPFRADGRTRLGCDCWGLVVVAYREYLGIELPRYDGALGDRKADPSSIKKAIEAESCKWKPVEDPKAFDLALFRTDGINQHIGIVVDRTQMLHTCPGAGSTVESFKRLEWKDRLEGFYHYAP